MNYDTNFHWLVYAWILLAVFVFPILFIIIAPYGRYTTPRSGFFADNRIFWFLMEIPSPLIILLSFLWRENVPNTITLLLFGLWEVHYFHRTILYPLKLKPDTNTTLITLFSGISFNLVNGYLNGRYLFVICDPDRDYMLSKYTSINWSSVTLVCGIILFFCGMYINIQSDHILISLKSSRVGKSYQIPRGGLFEYVSCANYFGEMVEWFGFLLVAQNIAALSFFIWTVANLVPRAIKHHRWYHKMFPDIYPRQRTAIIPFLL